MKISRLDYDACYTLDTYFHLIQAGADTNNFFCEYLHSETLTLITRLTGASWPKLDLDNKQQFPDTQYWVLIEVCSKMLGTVWEYRWVTWWQESPFIGWQSWQGECGRKTIIPKMSLRVALLKPHNTYNNNATVWKEKLKPTDILFIMFLRNCSNGKQFVCPRIVNNVFHVTNCQRIRLKISQITISYFLMFCLCYRLLERNAKSFVFRKGDYYWGRRTSSSNQVKLFTQKHPFLYNPISLFGNWDIIRIRKYL